METIVNNFTEIEKTAGVVAKSAWEKERDKWEEKSKFGYKKGIEKGIEKEKEKNAIQMLKRNFEIVLIQDITGLSIKRIKKIQKELKSLK